MRLYNRCDRDIYLEFLAWVDQNAVWNSPEKTKAFLRKVKKGMEGHEITRFVYGKQRTSMDAINDTLYGKHFLILKIDSPSGVLRMEEILDALGAESIELCRVKYRKTDKRYINPEKIAKSAYFIVLFDEYYHINAGKESRMQDIKRLEFKEVKTKFGFPLYSTLEAAKDGRSEYIPPTYCFSAFYDQKKEVTA